jgi:autoinducer 2-degrading protein
MTYTIIVRLRARDGALDRVLPAIAANASASLAMEPGCLTFDVLQSAEDPQSLVLYERYRDEEAFRSGHLTSEHYQRWRTVAEDCVEPGSQTTSVYILAAKRI